MNDYLEVKELYHHGILGQRWGVRRYQNPDGSLTSAGKKRYLKLDKEYSKKYQHSYERAKKERDDIINKAKRNIKESENSLKRINGDPVKNRSIYEKKAMKDIKDEKSFLKEDRGKNASNIDAMKSLLYFDKNTENKSEDQLFKMYVDDMIKGEHGNKQLKEFEEENISRYKKIIKEFENMSLSQLFEEAGKYTDDGNLNGASLYSLYNDRNRYK